MSDAILIITTDMLVKESQNRILEDTTLMSLPASLYVAAQKASIVLVCNSKRVWELKHRYNTTRISFPISDLPDYIKRYNAE
jgi:hypothetical protein